MLDLIHYFFEEDSRFSTAEEAEAVSQMRSVIYGMLYGTTYKYKVGKSSNSNVGEGFNTGETKPYIPPTEFDADSYLPFGNTLDAPLG